MIFRELFDAIQCEKFPKGGDGVSEFDIKEYGNMRDKIHGKETRRKSSSGSEERSKHVEERLHLPEKQVSVMIAG